MKHTRSVLLSAILGLSLLSCDNKEKFVDLNTGKTVTLVKDSTTGYMVNAETKEPVLIYVNTATKDTFYGYTGKVINNAVVKTEDGKYKYEDGDIKIKVGDDYKKKVEADGDIKIKDGDTKIKIEEDGDVKTKTDK